MTNEQYDLFGVRFNEEGKGFIVKFANISYVMLVLVIFQSGITFYWAIRLIVIGYNPATESLYNVSYPYASLIFSLFSIVSNIYYLRFPRLLRRSINANDEIGANRSFRVLYRGAFIFLLYLILSVANIIWGFWANQKIFN